MYFIDTNVLYWYCGRDVLNIKSDNKIDVNKLRVLLNNNETVLSTSAFIEAVVHYRNKPEKLKIIMNFLKDKKIRLYNNVPYYSLSDSEYSILLNLDNNELIKYAEKVLLEKINIEAKFTVVFLQIMVILYLRHKLEIEVHSNNIYDRLLQYVGSRELFNDEDKIRKELNIGYQEDNESKRQTIRSPLKYAADYWCDFRHSSGNSVAHGISGSNFVMSIFPFSSQSFGSSVSRYSRYL